MRAAQYIYLFIIVAILTCALCISQLIFHIPSTLTLRGIYIFCKSDGVLLLEMAATLAGGGGG